MTAATANSLALLTVAEMGAADRAAIAAGIPSERLMEAAGAAVAREIQRRYSARPIAVLCGPGNNGGDGFVAARLLADLGWPVRLALLGERAALKGDAALNADRWLARGGTIEAMSPTLLDGAAAALDALFGAGLARPLEGAARNLVNEINRRALDCVAVDVPSGVRGDTGEVLGGAESGASRCRLTVTFFRYKPGHFLYPGRGLAGELALADIGIPEAVLHRIAPRQHLNGPALWLDSFPWPRPEGHKYDRGHAIVVGGAIMTGAARLAARAALRAGAGLVSIACAPEVFSIYAADAMSALIAPIVDDDAFEDLLIDPRKNAVLVGPGNGLTPQTRARAVAALRRGKRCVLDADALSIFASEPEVLLRSLRADCLLTPHDGEFARLFRRDGDRLARARFGAQTSGAVLLLKGADTVIATPDGRAAINANAPPELATGGAGDVLAGIALGLMAQGMPAFDAGCAATWLHGEAASAVGPGLIAEDLPDNLPPVLRRLKGEAGR